MKKDKQSENEPNLATLLCSSYYGIALTEDEQARLSRFLQSNNLDKEPLDKKLLEQLTEANSRSGQQWPKLWNRIKSADAGINRHPDPPSIVRTIRKYGKVAIAAIVLAASGMLVYKYVLPGSAGKPNDQTVTISTEIPPGSHKAILLLSDNSSIDLNKKPIGNIANEDGTNIHKPDPTQIIYEASDNRALQKPGTNILNTPRAGTFKVTLPDKSVMYLNAESSVVYPVAFTGSTREVIVSKGEVYFEVAKSAKPFIVRKGDQSIEVLGTKFNINTYSKDNLENITTTLLEGSIQITKGRERLKLKPRDQVSFASNKANPEVKRNVNVEGVVSWKNGYFTFTGLSFREIMDELERWYDVNIIIDESTSGKLDGSRVTLSKISRNQQLDQVLKILRGGGKFSSYEMKDPKTIIIKK